MKEFTLYQDEDGQWVATSDRLAGFTARGQSRQEALHRMKQAFSVYYPCGDCRGSETDTDSSG